MSPPRATVLASSGGMAAGTIVSRLTGFVRDVLIVQAIGLAVFADTYSIANMLPNTVYILLIGGALNSVFVPALVRARDTDPDGGEGFAQSLLSLGVVALTLVTLVSMLAAPLLVRLYARDWGPAEYATATVFALYCLPQIFFYGVYNLLSQVLNVRGRFGPMMWAPILNNVVVIAVALAFVVLRNRSVPTVGSVTAGEQALLGIGTTLGVVLQALCLIPVLRATGFRLRFRGQWRGLGLRHLGRLGGWTLLFVLINQIAYVAIAQMATSVATDAQALNVQAGSYTSYSKAYMVFLLPHAIVTVSLVTALMPRMSAAALSGAFEEIRADVSATLRMVAIVTVPAAVAFLVLGPYICVVVYLGRPGSYQMGLVLSGFALGLVAFSAQFLVLRGFYALEDTRTPALLQVAIAGLNVGAAYAAYLALPLQWRLVGIAGAYALAYFVGLYVSMHLLSGRLDGIEGSRTLGVWVRLSLAAMLGGAVAYGVARAMTAALGRDYVDYVAALSVALVAGGLVYLLVTHLVRVRELHLMLAAARAALGR